MEVGGKEGGAFCAPLACMQMKMQVLCAIYTRKLCSGVHSERPWDPKGKISELHALIVLELFDRHWSAAHT